MPPPSSFLFRCLQLPQYVYPSSASSVPLVTGVLACVLPPGLVGSTGALARNCGM